MIHPAAVFLLLGVSLTATQETRLYRFKGAVKADKLPELLFFSPREPNTSSPPRPPVMARLDSAGRFTVDLLESVDYAVASHPPCMAVSDMEFENGRPVQLRKGPAGDEVTELPGVVTVIHLAAGFLPNGALNIRLNLPAVSTTVDALAKGVSVGATLAKLNVPIPVAVGAAGGIRLISDPCVAR
jgi:hypothetical protein